METGTSLFVKMWLEWRSKVPTRLAGVDPTTLIHLLELCSGSSGTSQVAAQRELGINQPRLSKLTKKLVQEGWIDVERSEKDGRSTPMKTTRAAQKWLSSMQERLNGFMDSPRPASNRIRKKEPKSKPETYSIFDEIQDPNAK